MNKVLFIAVGCPSKLIEAAQKHNMNLWIRSDFSHLYSSEITDPDNTVIIVGPGIRPDRLPVAKWFKDWKEKMGKNLVYAGYDAGADNPDQGWTHSLASHGCDFIFNDYSIRNQFLEALAKLVELKAWIRNPDRNTAAQRIYRLNGAVTEAEKWRSIHPTLSQEFNLQMAAIENLYSAAPQRSL